jgi:hypothetical protein
MSIWYSSCGARLHIPEMIAVRMPMLGYIGATSIRIAESSAMRTVNQVWQWLETVA